MIKFQQFSFQSEILPKSVRGPEIHVHRNMLKFFWKERYFNHYTLWVLSFCTLSSRLIEFCQENTLVIANTLFQQHKRNSTHGHHKMVKLNQIDYILCSQRWRSSTVSKNKTGADCGSDHEHLIAKLRLKLKKVGKTIRPFSSVQFSSVVSDSLQPHDSQHARPSYPSPTSRVGDAIQPSHPLLSPSPPAPNPSQHQSLFQWVNSSHEVAKVLKLQL